MWLRFLKNIPWFSGSYRLIESLNFLKSPIIPIIGDGQGSAHIIVNNGFFFFIVFIFTETYLVVKFLQNIIDALSYLIKEFIVFIPIIFHNVKNISTGITLVLIQSDSIDIGTATFWTNFHIRINFYNFISIYPLFTFIRLNDVLNSFYKSYSVIPRRAYRRSW